MKVLRLAALVAASSAFAFAHAQGKGPTDPQIAGIVVAANQIDIDAGKHAKSKSKNKEVQEFAQRMITDHTAVNKQVHDLLTKLNATPASNPTSESMTQQGQEASTRLGALSGAAYDKAYIDNEVTFHQQVINAAQTQLAPAAQNPELKDLLQKTMPVLQSHLDMAKQIQSSLPAS